MTNLYLFDIDGTLINTLEAHALSYQTAYKELFKLNIQKNRFVQKFGKSEQLMHHEICMEEKISPTEDNIGRLMECRALAMADSLEKEGIEVLPGVYEFLSELIERKEILGAVTGNPEKTGKALLSKSGLSNYFVVKSYAQGVEPRKAIVQRAVDKVGGYDFKRRVVIGDTPSDVEAGKELGLYTVAVATGHKTKEELLKAGADLTLDSLLEYKKIIG